MKNRHPHIIKNAHHKIQERSEMFGYESDEGGACFGIASWGVHAILSGKLNSFDNLIDEICITPVDDIVTEVKSAQQKHKNGEDLNDHEVAMLASQPFFYATSLYMEPERGKELFPDLIAPEQDILQSSKFILPDVLENEGGLAIADKFTGAYTPFEIIELFNTFMQCLKKENVKHPIAFALHSTNHTLTVGFDPDIRDWILIEANALPSQLISSDVLASVLQQLFNFHVFATDVIVTKTNAATTTLVLSKFKSTESYKKLHAVTTERVRITDGFDASWLHIAARNGDLALVKEIAKLYQTSRIDIDQFSKEGFTALSAACAKGHIDIVEFLLNQKANPNGLALGKKTVDALHCPLILASQNGHTEIVDLLLHAGADVNLISTEGTTPLIQAAKNGNTNIVSALLKSGADLDNISESSPLLFACMNGHTEVARMLIESGADINRKIEIDNSGQYKTALSGAVNFRHVDVIKLLLQSGADPNIETFMNLIYMAMLDHRPQIVELLLTAGANPNAIADDKINTPLLFMAMATDIEKNDSKFECIQALLKFGANPNSKNTDGCTALAAAITSGIEDMVKCILVYHPDLNDGGTLPPPLSIAVEMNNKEIARRLLEAGALIDLTDSHGQTSLFIAVNKRSSALVSILLAAGANPNIARSNGTSMLHIAAMNGDTDIVRQLLAYGAEVNQSVEINSNQSTALIKAIDFARMRGNAEVIRLIEQHMQAPEPPNKRVEGRFFSPQGKEQPTSGRPAFIDQVKVKIKK